MTYLYSKHFSDFNELATFVNDNAIEAADILKIDADTSNAGWVFWWYGEPP